MKKILLLAFILSVVFTAANAQTLNCSNICVQNIDNLNLTNNTLDVTIFNGDTNQINYPIVIVTNTLGDTVANINSYFYMFAQLDSTTITHTIPTTLTTLSTSFTGTVYISDPIWGLTCSFSYPMSCTAGIQESFAQNSITLFPNPATEQVNISLSTQNYTGSTISIIDISGKTVKKVSAQLPMTTISTNDLSKGIYLVKVQTSGAVFTTKLLIQ